MWWTHFFWYAKSFADFAKFCRLCLNVHICKSECKNCPKLWYLWLTFNFQILFSIFVFLFFQKCDIYVIAYIFANLNAEIVVFMANFQFSIIILHITQPDWTLFLFKTIWTRPQGCQGCPKNRKVTRINTLKFFCTNIQPKLYKLRKTS